MGWAAGRDREERVGQDREERVGWDGEERAGGGKTTARNTP